MSRSSQRKYLNVMKVIDEKITSENEKVKKSPSSPNPSTITYLSDTDFDSIYKVASTFRTSLSRDVGSRIFIFSREVGDSDLDDETPNSSSGSHKVSEEDDRKSRYRERET